MFKIELSESLANVVMEALAAQPLHKSFDAFVAIRNQIAMQRQTPPMISPPAEQQADVPKANGAAT